MWDILDAKVVVNNYFFNSGGFGGVRCFKNKGVLNSSPAKIDAHEIFELPPSTTIKMFVRFNIDAWDA